MLAQQGISAQTTLPAAVVRTFHRREQRLDEMEAATAVLVVLGVAHARLAASRRR